MIRVTCAIIMQDEKILAVQRSETMPQPLQWEFPGGKIKTGESEEDSLIRELKEELDITIKPLKRLMPNTHHYPDKSIELIPFVCEIVEGSIVLHEHKTMQWLKREELMNLNWCEADIPIAKQIL
jgi:8-oxo-dGTP diphosphatase